MNSLLNNGMLLPAWADTVCGKAPRSYAASALQILKVNEINPMREKQAAKYTLVCVYNVTQVL